MWDQIQHSPPTHGTLQNHLLQTTSTLPLSRGFQTFLSNTCDNTETKLAHAIINIIQKMLKTEIVFKNWSKNWRVWPIFRQRFRPAEIRAWNFDNHSAWNTRQSLQPNNHFASWESASADIRMVTSLSVWKGLTTTACSSTWTSTTTSIQHRHHLCGDLQYNKMHN